MENKEQQLLAKTFKGLEEVLAKELIEIGANNVQIERRAVSFTGDLAMMYKSNLCCRTATRILMPLKTFKAKTADEVYEMAKDIEWDTIMETNQTFQIDATVFSNDFRNSQFVTYRVKDAIVDYFNEKLGKRPSVRLTNPDFYINVHISQTDCTILLDSSGESLHKRGYRSSQTEAPISEVLAAGMLEMAEWNGQCDFVDPMCGSGTFLIEAALKALNIPPCIYRQSFAFEKWKNFDKDLYDSIYNDDSMERPLNFKIKGYDISARAIEIAQENIKSAGLSKYITVEQRSITDWEVQTEKCLIVTNPPYGERLLNANLYELYAQLGETLKHKFPSSTAWVISSHIECMQNMGLRPSKKIKLLNGALNCEFWKLELFSGKRNDFIRTKAQEA
ncbi:MAG: RNA methyltransferase [Sphingobacteriia bacterium]|jgi:putative N6-adenine-specific DNA methylase|nr:THUMP domain-containing protein [Paludibacteraceae bacterium]NCA78689.1 RNA methyltransferase [Sphingobacteriia bacterium]